MQLWVIFEFDREKLIANDCISLEKACHWDDVKRSNWIIEGANRDSPCRISTYHDRTSLFDFVSSLCSRLSSLGVVQVKVSWSGTVARITINSRGKFIAMKLPISKSYLRESSENQRTCKGYSTRRRKEKRTHSGRSQQSKAPKNREADQLELSSVQ